ncbi:MAG: phage tail tube protein [Thermus aquaticus]|uniref:phage tail tube protein n=1 Tax=Thermus aquaticus TaxID=271 RepID=UPI003C0528E1
MPLNFGYVGVGKETTRGTAVAPNTFFRATRPVAPALRQEMAEVPDISNYGVADLIPTARHVEGDLAVVVTPNAIGTLLTALLGNPTTTGTAPNYTHTFTPKTTTPTYTVEAQSGVGIFRTPGAVVGELEFSHAATGILEAAARYMARDKTTHSVAATPTVETVVFTPTQVSLSVDGVSLQAYGEDLRLRLSYPKEVVQTFGTATPYDILPTGEGDVTLEATVVFDSTAGANWLNRYTAGTAVPVSVGWTRDTNTSLTVTFTGWFAEDPYQPQNNDLRFARVRLSLRGRASSLQVVLRNSQASY